MAHFWARIQAFEFSRFVLFEPAAGTMQKINPVGSFNFVAECLFIYIYFLFFEENHEDRISKAGEKNYPTISLFFRKMIA